MSQNNKSKRHLSDSSLSPRHDVQKSKVFITPNKYAVLANDETPENVSKLTTVSTNSKVVLANQPPTNEEPDPPAPPVYIKNISNYSAFNATLSKIMGPNGFTCKSTSTYLIVQPLSRSNFNKIVTHLN